MFNCFDSHNGKCMKNPNPFKNKKFWRFTLVFLSFVLGAVFVATCASEDPTQDFGLVYQKAILHDYGPIKPLFDKAALKKFLSEKHSVKKKNNVVFIMIDTLRRDYMTDELAPNIKAFLREQGELRGVSSSTITHHSSFSIFYGLGAYLRDFVLKDEWDIGSPFLKILKNVGYRLAIYGSPWQYCTDEKRFFTADIELKEFSESNLQILYGKRTKDQVDFCYEHGQRAGAPQLYPDVPIKAVDEQKRTFGHQAYMDFRVAEDFLRDIKNQKEKNFYLLYFFSPHLPYAWPDSGPLAEYAKRKGLTFKSPNVPWNPGEEAFKDKPVEAKINAYKNSVIWVDFMFKRVIDRLKKMGKYDDTLIVLYSDHGEFLHDDTGYKEVSDRVGHCCTPYPENSLVPLVYKFPANDPTAIVKRGDGNLGSHVDIVPTVLDYLGFSGLKEYEKFIHGKSILREKRNCAVSFSPAGIHGPRIFTITTPQNTLFMQLNDPRTLRANGFYWASELIDRMNIHNVDKNDDKDVARFKEFLNNPNFMECVDEVFDKY